MIKSKHNVAAAFSAATAMVVLTLVGTTACWAQQKPLKAQLIGAWTLISWDVTSKDGTKRPSDIVGQNPKGILILDASGRFAQVRGHADRPKLKNPSPRKDIPAAELGEVTRSFGAAYGTWSVNEADKTLTQKLELALIPNNSTNEIKISVGVIKDELKLVWVSAGGGAKNEMVYRRAK